MEKQIIRPPKLNQAKTLFLKNSELFQFRLLPNIAGHRFCLPAEIANPKGIKTSGNVGPRGLKLK